MLPPIHNHQRWALPILITVILMAVFTASAGAAPMPADGETIALHNAMPIDAGSDASGSLLADMLSCADPADPAPCVLVDPALITGLMDGIFSYVEIFVPMLMQIMLPIISLKIGWGLSLAIVSMIFAAFATLATLGGIVKF